MKEKIEETLKVYGVEAALEEDFLSWQLPELCLQSLRTEELTKSVPFVCDVTDIVFSHAADLGYAPLASYLALLMSAPRPRIEALLTFEPWLMTLVQNFPEDLKGDSALADLLPKVLFDPWSIKQIRPTSLWNDNFRYDAANVATNLEEWLYSAWKVTVDSVERYDQGATIKAWLPDMFQQAKKKGAPASAFAALALISTGPSREDHKAPEHVWDDDFDMKKKHWNYPIILHAVTDLARSFDRGEELLKGKAGAEAYRDVLQSLWKKVAPLEADLETLRAFVFLAMTFQACPYEYQGVLKRRFPGAYDFT
jgi:hypothetical protein